MAVTSMGRSSISAPGKTNRASGNLPLPNARVSGTTGSPVTTTYNGQTLYIFKGDGSVTFPGDCVADLFLLGAGGGGGKGGGGGGGGGAIREYLAVPFKAGTYTVTVGAGGAIGFAPGGGGYVNAKNGYATTIGKYEAPGGGGGASNNGNPNTITINGLDGGCGGGGSWNNSNINESGSGGVATDGFDGGQGEYLSGGGGGGMGVIGTNGSASTGGNGGNGLTTDWIDTTIATTNSIGEVSGVDVYFAGGAGGYSYAYVSQSDGGLGGGADCTGSGYSGGGQAGTPNTGGGGSGANAGTPGIGGSGLLIVRV